MLVREFIFKMHILTRVTVLTLVTDLVFTENKLNLNPTASEQTPQDSTPASPSPVKRSTDKPFLNSMWVYRPSSHPAAFDAEDVGRDRVVLRPGVSVTRLAKSLYYGFDPYFHKAYFEPFETRAKPVRLVALNRNGKIPRERIRMVINEKTPNVAELQSPFNEVGNFWLEENVMQQ